MRIVANSAKSKQILHDNAELNQEFISYKCVETIYHESKIRVTFDHD